MDSLRLVDTDQPADIGPLMLALGQAARASARALALSSNEQRNHALTSAAAHLRARANEILAANAADVTDAKARGTVSSFLDRLTLDPARVDGIARDVEAVAALPDPLGRVLANFKRPNGLTIERVATPLGVIGVIFESRPNVTADAAALCLKSGNATILRGGSESFRTSRVIHDCFVAGLKDAGLPEACISLVPTRDRAAVGAMLTGLQGNLDVIVPRGGKSLIARVQSEARVPVFAHLEGIVHVFVHAAADAETAKHIVLNSKMRRTGICGAAETLLVDEACAPALLPALVHMLLDAGCDVRGDAAARAVDLRVSAATQEDWSTEYLDSIIAMKVVAGLDAAINHIETYGSHHTDCIITQDENAAARFLREVDSAIVLHNASTQFADGGEFGFGAEIGISTGRMHARGPVGAEQLTSYNYRVRGNGQVRG